mmetsp:Transcript_37281/g.81181  ORF Transcript_37281/g.81181 Transcript_37281/m.81181 type:complete len:214 (+) Transcript_37281:120-761(+)
MRTKRLVPSSPKCWPRRVAPTRTTRMRTEDTMMTMGATTSSGAQRRRKVGVERQRHLLSPKQQRQSLIRKTTMMTRRRSFQQQEGASGKTRDRLGRLPVRGQMKRKNCLWRRCVCMAGNGKRLPRTWGPETRARSLAMHRSTSFGCACKGGHFRKRCGRAGRGTPSRGSRWTRCRRRRGSTASSPARWRPWAWGPRGWPSRARGRRTRATRPT